MGASRRTRAPNASSFRDSNLLEFAAAMARGLRDPAMDALARARRAGAARVAAEETALMLVLHAGYPAALEALALLMEAWPGRPRAVAEGDRSRWRRNGERLCRRVYADAYPKLIANVRRLHPTLAVWMVEQGYGRVLSRPFLSDRDRERVAVAVLAAGGWERQLVSHLLGADRVGVPRVETRRALEIGRGFAEARSRAACARAWRRAFGRDAGVRR
jgi:alkylhydroperoxidase/carboxymuconolactone decarboxylase family protein YurZ